MECFAMNLRRMIMATGTAALLAVATITTASAQGVQVQERARTNAGASGPNLSTSGQVNAQGRAGTSGANTLGGTSGVIAPAITPFFYSLLKLKFASGTAHRYYFRWRLAKNRP
jgi:hypothetical protein